VQEKYESYVPKEETELCDMLGSMLLASPKFEADPVYFPDLTIHTEFKGLDAGINLLRPQLGEEIYAKLIEMYSQAKHLFEADPDDTTGETKRGREIILDMLDMVTELVTVRDNSSQ
jgi:hypothetical protein